jgi:hypothetical protein
MNRPITRRLTLISLTALAAAALTACSGPYHVSAEVASFGSWPAERKPGSYAFDRLPSQQQGQQQSKRQGELEEAARAALAKAGFTPAADPKAADVLVSLGARSTAVDLAPWDDPLWWRWRGGLVPLRYAGTPGHGGWIGWRSSPYFDRRFERSVALLMRDRASGEAIFEAHASNDGATMGDTALLGALFGAALADFPKASPEPRRVTVQAVR